MSERHICDLCAGRVAITAKLINGIVTCPHWSDSTTTEKQQPMTDLRTVAALKAAMAERWRTGAQMVAQSTKYSSELFLLNQLEAGGAFHSRASTRRKASVEFSDADVSKWETNIVKNYLTNLDEQRGTTHDQVDQG